MAYKFLKIGIVVGPTSHIEIAIGETTAKNHSMRSSACYVDGVHRKMGRYLAIDAIIYTKSNDIGSYH